MEPNKTWRRKKGKGRKRSPASDFSLCFLCAWSLDTDPIMSQTLGHLLPSHYDLLSRSHSVLITGVFWEITLWNSAGYRRGQKNRWCELFTSILVKSSHKKKKTVIRWETAASSNIASHHLSHCWPNNFSLHRFKSHSSYGGEMLEKLVLECGANDTGLITTV